MKPRTGEEDKDKPHSRYRDDSDRDREPRGLRKGLFIQKGALTDLRKCWCEKCECHNGTTCNRNKCTCCKHQDASLYPKKPPGRITF